jgi:hypothetical protein
MFFVGVIMNYVYKCKILLVCITNLICPSRTFKEKFGQKNLKLIQ